MARGEKAEEFVAQCAPKLLEQLHTFFDGLERERFYDAYTLLSALAGPNEPDFEVEGGLHSMKHVTRRLRITIMGKRFLTDYSDPYQSSAEVRAEIARLRPLWRTCPSAIQRRDLARQIRALEVLEKAL